MPGDPISGSTNTCLNLPGQNEIVNTVIRNSLYNQAMKNYKKTILITSFTIEFIIALMTLFFKISHWPNNFAIIIIGVIAGFTFMVITLNEVITSNRINKFEKIMWIICLIFLFNFAGLLYLIYSRKRIISLNEQFK